MVVDLKDQIREFVSPDNYRRCLGVTLTMKQRVDEERLDEIKSSQNFRHFLNLLNKDLLGKKFSRFGTRINVIPVLESTLGHRIHYHTIFEVPLNVRSTDFMRTVERCWKKTRWGYEHVHHHNHIDEGWLDYLTKFKSYKDDIDWMNLNWDRDRRL